MNKLLLITGGREVSPALDALTKEGEYFLLVADTVREGLDIMAREGRMAAILADTPSKLENFRELIDSVAEQNSYVFSTPILIITGAAGDPVMNDDIALLGGPVVDLIRRPIHPWILKNRLEQARKLANSLSFSDFSKMLAVLPSLIYLKDDQGRYVFSTKIMRHLTAANLDELRGKTDPEVRLDHENAEEALQADLEIVRTGKGTSYVIDVNVFGRQEYLQIIKEPIRDDAGTVRGVIALINDVTEQELLRRALTRVSITDRLTGLYNRSYLDDYRRSLQENGLYPVSVITADCDGLKVVNDTRGHQVGDRYLLDTVALLRSCLPESAVLFRTGGDEFTAFLPGISLDAAESYVSIMRSSMGSYRNGARALSVSFGCSLMNGPEDFDACLRISDEAMYRDKRRRKKERHE